MAILSDIISVLGRMDSALFQQLGDELLTAIYKPINIESRGTKEESFIGNLVEVVDPTIGRKRTLPLHSM